MEYNGYIKIHRRVLHSPLFQNDHTAWRIFFTLLLLADFKNGTWNGGRNQLAALSGVKSNTAYKAIKRLEEGKLVSTVSTTRWTAFHICNYEKYQNTDTARIQRDEHSIKKQELRSNTIKSTSSEPDVQAVFDQYIKEFEADTTRFKLTPRRKAKIRSRLAKGDAGNEMLKVAITRVSQSEFHRGANERGWRANLDWIIKSYEQVEKCYNLEPKPKPKLNSYIKPKPFVLPPDRRGTGGQSLSKMYEEHKKQKANIST